MANYLSDRTGASIDAVLDDADAIGKAVIPPVTQDLDTLSASGFHAPSAASANNPTASRGVLINAAGESTGHEGQIWISTDDDSISYRRKFGSFGAWHELYHTGNTGFFEFSSATTAGGLTKTIFNTGQNRILHDTASAGSIIHVNFYNPNGSVGTITTSGTATAYNTSSDPRLKDFAEAPTDLSINTEFDKLFSCFRTFNWKSDPEGDLVWGFDAHACIDTGTDIGSEGEGPRGSSLGAVYETIPAVTESRVVMDAEGNPTSEIETVVITAAIEKKVSPAGVDQSKAVPVLLAKIEQLERRLTLAGL